MAELPHQLHAAELRPLGLLADDWPDATFLYDRDHQQFLYVNKAAEDLIGATRNEICQLQPQDIFYPDDEQRAAEIRARADVDGWVRCPWRIVRRDGTVIQTELTLTRRHIDGCTFSQTVFRVTEVEQQGDAPAAGDGDERLEILERTSIAVVTVDPEGIVTSWNAGATEHYQLRADETVGKQVRDLARTEEARADIDSLFTPHDQRDEWISRLTIRRMHDEFEALITCSAIRTDAGELSGFLFISAPVNGSQRSSTPRMRRARVECAACGREVAGTMRRKYCSEKCRQWAYYHRHLDAQRERSRQRHERRRTDADGDGAAVEATNGPSSPNHARL